MKPSLLLLKSAIGREQGGEERYQQKGNEIA